MPTSTSDRPWSSRTLPWLAVATLGVACGTTGAPCTPGQQIACACDDGSASVQVCEDDGASYGACACDGDPADTDVAGETDVSGDTDAAGETDVSGETDVTATCDETPIFAGLVAVDDATTGYSGASVWSYGGDVGLAAGQAMCAALYTGAHVCDYEELVDAEARPAGVETALEAVAEGTTIWIHRTTTAQVGGEPSSPGAGGRCNDWTYATNHIADGEFARFGTGGDLTFVLDNDTVYDPANPGVHTLVDLQCGGVDRAIACCVACTP